MSPRLVYVSQCQICNPHEPLMYEDPEQRDREAHDHADLTGHWVEVGFTMI